MVQVAAGMMAGCLPPGSCAARIMLFAGGPPTVGSGKVVDMELVQPISGSILRGTLGSNSNVQCFVRALPDWVAPREGR